MILHDVIPHGNFPSESTQNILGYRVGYQWRRSVVKYGGQSQSGQAIKLFQITPYTPAISKHSTISVQDRLYSRRKKLVLAPIFDTSFILDDVKLAELSNRII